MNKLQGMEVVCTQVCKQYTNGMQYAYAQYTQLAQFGIHKKLSSFSNSFQM